jgi:S-formylglutathione hydrolase FrmB
MAFCELHYFSSALQMQVAANVILPEDKDQKGPFPVFYLLHGLSDDHTIWLRRTSIERYVQSLPLIVVMPQGGRGFYTDAEQGFAYETAIVSDLIGYVDTMFHTKAERGGRCIGGLSMGGYGAVKLALRHPDLFCSANSHSGALAWGHKPFPGEDAWNREMRRIVGEKPTGGPSDLFALATQIDKVHLPVLRIDCGTEDFLLQDNRDYHKHLEKSGLPHEYQEFPGAHDWAYWDIHIQEALRFHARHLKI